MRTFKKSVIKEILETLADRVNLLIRANIINPFQAMTSDITEIIYNYGRSKAYLAVRKDCLGQMVYGYEIGETMKAKLAVDSFRRAVAAIKKTLGRMAAGNAVPPGSGLAVYEL